MHTYDDYSGWTAPPADTQSTLTEQTRTEIAIIGGGYTGLMAAISLCESGVDVVVLEQSFCGFGASGRNAGHLTPTIGRDIAYCLKQFGKDKGLKLAHFADSAVGFTEDVLRRYNIDCDYTPCGNIISGVHPRQRQTLESAAEMASAAGVKMTFLDEDAMRERQLPKSFLFGIQEHAGGLLHPGKYIMALRKIAIDKGVRIYEQTPVTRIDESETVTLHTPQGTVRSNKVLVATNAFTAPSLGRMRSAIVPLRVTLFNSRPLTEPELSQVGWRGREGIYTAHELLESYRLTADNRITGGSKWIQYGYGSTLPQGNRPRLFEDFRTLFKQRFPELRGVELETFWGGWIGMTLDMLPMCGVEGRHRNIFYSVGYNGHGVAQASMLGHRMAREMLGEPQDEVALLQRRTLPLPPEPLRWLAVNAIKQAMALKDAGVDRTLDAG